MTHLSESLVIIPWPRLHADNGCVEMCDFCMAALMFLRGHAIKARIHACTEIAYFLTQRIIRTWRALSLWPCAFQALKMHLIGKCAISTHAWVLAIILPPFVEWLTGITFGLLEMRSALVTWRVPSSVQRTSKVNSTAQSWQNSSHVQSCNLWPSDNLRSL